MFWKKPRRERDAEENEIESALSNLRYHNNIYDYHKIKESVDQLRMKIKSLEEKVEDQKMKLDVMELMNKDPCDHVLLQNPYNATSSTVYSIFAEEGYNESCEHLRKKDFYIYKTLRGRQLELWVKRGREPNQEESE